MEGMKLAAAALALVAAGAARGEDVQWYLQVDNDVAFATDRWYTSGVHIARTHRASETARWEFGLVQEIYTPNTNDYQPDDRPYAARLFGYGAHHEYLPGRHRTLAVALGVLGESALGRQSQEFVHHFVPAPEDDWSRQLSDRPDVQAIGVQSDDLPFCPAGRCVAHYGAVLGNNLTFAHAGFELRTGGPQQLTTSALRFAPTPPIAAAHGWSGYAGASARWVARNVLLEGNADPGRPDVSMNHGVVRIAAGVAWSADWGTVTFSLVQDSREFDTQRAMQRFGILAVHLGFL